MEELKVSYSFDYLKEVFNYILVPVFIVLLIVVVGLFIYSRKEKDHTTEKYQYTINFWSYLMCIILSAALFAIALSFVVSLHNSIAGRPVDKTNLIYIVYLSPIIPLLFLISTGYRWIRMFLKYKENKKDDIDYDDNDNDNNDNDDRDDNNYSEDDRDVSLDKKDSEENNNIEESNENNIEENKDNSVEIESMPLEKGITPIPVTLKEEDSEIVEDESESPIPVVVEESKDSNDEDEKKIIPDVEEPSEIKNNVVKNNIEESIEENLDIEDLDETKDIEVLDLD